MTQLPNRINMTTDDTTPIPIESIFFLENSKRDPQKPNRFYFNYPAQWCTSNRGESIIGVRNLYLNARRRKLEFVLSVRKYFRDDFDKYNNEFKSIDEVVNDIPEYKKSQVSYKITSWLSTERDLREIFSDVQIAIQSAFNNYNEYYANQRKMEIEREQNKIDMLEKEIEDLINQRETETTEANKQELRKQIDVKYEEIQQIKANIHKNLRPLFRQEVNDLKRRDVQMDGYYDYNKKTFIETIYSPMNEKNNNDSIKNVFDKDRYDYYVDFKIEFIPRPYNKNTNKQDNSFNQIYDFVDVMNIGMEDYQNSPKKYMTSIYDNNGNLKVIGGKWMREITFENVWDRHSCKVFASFAQESTNGYLGNSQIYFNPIKYFKLNSTDQQFWIEFYSGRHNMIPSVIPINDSFNMEIQFLPYNKMLYV